MGAEPVRRRIAGLLTLAMLCFVTACGSQESSDISMPETYFSEVITETEPDDKTDGQKAPEQSKILIAYFTWAVNARPKLVEKVSAVLPDSQIESNVLGVYRDDIPQSRESIQNWLEEIGY